MMGAALTSVYGWVLLRLMVKDNVVSPLMANGGSMLIGSAMALLHSLSVEAWTPLPIAPGGSLPFLGWTVVMALVSNVICYNLYAVF